MLHINLFLACVDLHSFSTFRAPEVILGLPLSEAIDMWALGNMMFSLVTGGMFHAPNCEYDAVSHVL